MVWKHEVLNYIPANYFLDVHVAAQATLNKLPTPPEKFTRDFVMHYAAKFPGLPSDLGVDGITKFNFDTLVVLKSTEDTWVSSFVDKHWGKVSYSNCVLIFFGRDKLNLSKFEVLRVQKLVDTAYLFANQLMLHPALFCHDAIKWRRTWEAG